MKAKTSEENFKRKPRPFLIFPLIDDKENYETQRSMPKNPGLKLFTKIHPQKLENNKDKEQRPLTATLERPAILDINLITKIDMSIIRKEFLNITNLCRIPISAKVKKKKQFVICRPLSICAAELDLKKKVRRIETNSDDSWEDDESSRSARAEKASKKNLFSSNSKISHISVSRKSAISSDKNNNRSVNLDKKVLASTDDIKDSLKKDVTKSSKIPEPCKTCGRPNQPERFHSHPETPPKALKKVEIAVKIPVKNIVQKPVAIKYTSKQPSIKKPLPIRKPSLPAQVLEHTPPQTAQNETMDAKPASRVGSAKRTLTCYICGREFGTASLPLHEPKCLEKWERENKNLPLHLRRSTPVKPDTNCSLEEWNRRALEIFQSKLLPCQKCGRTFNPESLIIHQRSCKDVQNSHTKTPTDISPMSLHIEKSIDNTKPKSPLNIQCTICGKMFGSHSIKIHERQCLKKKQLESGTTKKSTKETSRPGLVSSESKSPTKLRNPLSIHSPKTSRPSSERKPQIIPCYLCGKMFSIASIHIHEPQCLKMWRMENDKLPAHKRRKEPTKPEIKYTRDGKIDFEATTEDIWQTHLNQLVACSKCSRTFNPDRVEIHERNCKG